MGFDDEKSEIPCAFIFVLAISEGIAALVVKRDWFEESWHYYAAVALAGIGAWACLYVCIALVVKVVIRLKA